MLLPMYMNWFTNFRGLLFKEEMAPSWLKQTKLSKLRLDNILGNMLPKKKK